MLFEQIAHVAHGMLGLRHSETVAGHNDNGRGILHDIGRIVCAARLHGLVTIGSGRDGVTAKSTEQNRDEGTIHSLAHDVG